MNNDRRKFIKKSIATFDEIKAKAVALKEELDALKTDLEGARDEEQEYYDNMHENLQGGEKGERAQEFISACDEHIQTLEEACEQMDNVENLDLSNLKEF